jgi:quercetin dioxygenase-like cupin family protein
MDRRFYLSADFEETEVRPGLFGSVIEGQKATMVRWEFAPDMPQTGIHWHEDHEQFGVVISGRIETEIDGVVRELVAGEMYHVPKGLPHGKTRVLGQQAAVVLDFFSPPREEYVAAAHGGAAFDPVARS